MIRAQGVSLFGLLIAMTACQSPLENSASPQLSFSELAAGVDTLMIDGSPVTSYASARFLPGPDCEEDKDRIETRVVLRDHASRGIPEHVVVEAVYLTDGRRIWNRMLPGNDLRMNEAPGRAVWLLDTGPRYEKAQHVRGLVRIRTADGQAHLLKISNFLWAIKVC